MSVQGTEYDTKSERRMENPKISEKRQFIKVGEN